MVDLGGVEPVQALDPQQIATDALVDARVPKEQIHQDDGPEPHVLGAEDLGQDRELELAGDDVAVPLEPPFARLDVVLGQDPPVRLGDGAGEQEKAHDGDGEGDDAADDVNPAPGRDAGEALQVLRDAGRDQAGRHVADVDSDRREAASTGELTAAVPRAWSILSECLVRGGTWIGMQH